MAHEIFTVPFEVRFTEIDQRWGATPVAMFNYFQETAIAHSRSRERGPAELMERGVGWFLMRIHFRFGRRPRWGERIVAQTWPSSLAGLHARREFRIRSAEGETLAEATTSWVMIDLKRRRPIRLPPWIMDAYRVSEARAIDDAFEEIPLLGAGAGCAERMFHVRQSDLDTNNHANSACYLDWMIETVPPDVLAGMRVAEIEIAYKREARADEDLKVISADEGRADGDERSFLHAIYRGEEPAALAAGRSRWVREPGGGTPE